MKMIIKVFFAGALVAHAVLAMAADDEIKVTLKDHRFSPAEIRVPAGARAKLSITNQDATVEEFESHTLNREKLIRPGQTVMIPLPALAPGRYDFFGEFNPETAKGQIIVE